MTGCQLTVVALPAQTSSERVLGNRISHVRKTGKNRRTHGHFVDRVIVGRRRIQCHFLVELIPCTNTCGAHSKAHGQANAADVLWRSLVKTTKATTRLLRCTVGRYSRDACSHGRADVSTKRDELTNCCRADKSRSYRRDSRVILTLSRSRE